MYAPTHRSDDGQKDEDHDKLQAIIDSVLEDNVLVFIRNWNARVGSIIIVKEVLEIRVGRSPKLSWCGKDESE